MRLRECSLMIFALLTVVLPAQASEWYPIDIGRYWVYSNPAGESFSATVEAPDSFAGSLVQPLLWDSGTREMLSQDEAGRVFHHGFTGAPDGSYVVHDPPFLLMDSELTLGHEWETILDVIEYNADSVETWRIVGARQTFRVIGFGPVDVPAGTFQAAEVLLTRDTGTTPYQQVRNWYADRIGLIRGTDANGTTVRFELEDYGPRGVPTKATTWGAVKSLYEK